MMVNITNTFRDETKVTRLAPNQQVQRHVEQLAAEISAASRNDDVRLPAHVGAPGGVVLQQFAPESPENAGVERVDQVRRRLEPHLGVGQVEDQMLPLIPNVVGLEPEGEAEPVHEVVVRVPGDKLRLPEVPDGA